MGVKISELPAATTPLAGADTLLVVQGGETKKAPVSGLPVTGLSNPMTAEGDIIVGSTGGAPNRLGKGAALQVLRVNSAGTALEYADPATGGGSLTNFTEAKSTASPNSTIPVVSISVSITEANGDLAIVPKGTGGLLAAVPTGSATGGNKRGIHAVDWQTSRTAAAQVASGAWSTIVGGQQCTASAQHAVAGGSFAEASGPQSIALGGQNPLAQAQWSTAIGGNGATAVSQYSTAIGGNNVYANASYAVSIGGSNNIASGDSSSIVGGVYAVTRGIVGAEARASGRFSAQGDAQRERFIMRRATTDATAAVLSSDGGSPVANNQIVLPNNSAYGFIGRIVARAAATGDCASWEIKGAIKRGANAAATALVAAVTPSLVAGDSGASSWTVAVTANSTLGCLTITVTGAGATSIKWVADIETVEVVG